MDVERARQGLNESDVDQVLRAALNIRPSPPFLARVRARVAQEPMTSPWTSSLAVVASATVAVAAIVAIVAIVKFQPEPSSVPRYATESPSHADGSTDRAAPPETAEPAPPEKAAEWARSEKAVESVPAGPDRPRRQAGAEVGPVHEDVLLSSRDSQAFRTLLDAARAGRITVAPSVADAQFTSVTSQPFEDIPVPAITIPPITIELLRPVSQ